MKSDSQTTVVAGPRVQQLLQKLHAISDAEEKSWSQRFFYLTRLVRFFAFDETWSATADEHISIGACNVIEAGTSFGLSTIYLALAVGQNVLLQRKIAAGTTSLTGKVIATEKEHAKAVKARLHWKEAGDEVEPWIELREGDLLETLKVDEGMLERIDLLLLDVWTPLALPTLKLVQPRLKYGAVVITDNVGIAKLLYRDFLEYIRNPENGFRSLTLPYSGGLELSVYLP
ncbi:uncharacterized protein A1O9_09443 [Exophiala aquamarina CBS 119918]|uniref:O-methyltransferase n=1 Tax=Exophiala aquamarina CBS 119918 TaxID=1182545 RepID=A0A072P3N0_9EURO|nr:uncharacterized protein A1O9_09443 [Exophiala aquamarina CBS 119918]KEF54277.1 hypothetical protein A1O9_09443 [Exophiala aquamarina CBS 119918]